jgi:acetyltransferase-like isoleucine patch superfamily enzyme
MATTNQYFLPTEDVNEEKATIVKFYFNPGDEVNKGDEIYSFETTKAVVSVEADNAGFIYFFASEGQELEYGSLVCEISKEKKLIGVKLDESYTRVYEKELQLTKKATLYAKKYNIDISKLGLEGLIKEKDLYPFIQKDSVQVVLERCQKLDLQKKFVQQLLNDESFRNLPSQNKIEKYRENGHKIGKNVQISKGTILIGNRIEIGNDVSIGKYTTIESPYIRIGRNTTIEDSCEIVGSVINIGDYNKISKMVNVDISGGRFPDSELITGKGCLIAYGCYINICRRVEIGNNVALSPKSMVYTHSYWQSILEGYSANFGPVKFHDNSWLGSMAQVLPNVDVGVGSIIMSNSVAINNVAPFTMIGGVPAKIIKEKVNKKINKKDKQNIIQGLFSELPDWLYAQQFDIEKIDNHQFTVTYGIDTKSCMLQIENGGQLGSIHIINSSDRESNSEKEQSTKIDFQKDTVEGPVGKIEFMVIEFFRRRGIRFYEQ